MAGASVAGKVLLPGDPIEVPAEGTVVLVPGTTWDGSDAATATKCGRLMTKKAGQPRNKEGPTS